MVSITNVAHNKRKVKKKNVFHHMLIRVFVHAGCVGFRVSIRLVHSDGREDMSGMAVCLVKKFTFNDER